tara:strand:+ start:771 stop:2321 length:1551 start_codon:yes stop_codon:yes gene_type:complete
MGRKLLEISNLSIFNDEESLVDGSDFSVDFGEVVGLFGESGSGKSVFSLFLLGLLDPGVFGFSFDSGAFNFSSGAFNLSSKNLADWLMVRKNSVSMIFQDPTTVLNPTMTCGKQIEEACFNIPLSDRFNYCLKLLSEVNILDCEKTYFSFPHQLSGGQKQRVVIAIALASEPEFLIADEPTTSLDPSTQRSVLDLVLSLKKSRSFGVVLISHDLNLIKYYCDRVYVFKNSRFLSFSDKSAEPYVSVLEKTLLKIKNRKRSGFSIENIGFYKNPISSVGDSVFNIKNLSVSFSKKNSLFFALKKISINVSFGDCLGVVGCSGSGKTTLGRVLCGLQKNYSGSFIFPGEGSFLKDSVQMVYQDPFSSFNPKHTIKDSVVEVIKLYKTKYSVSDLFNLVSLNYSLAERFPHELSGGQKQRASIARVLASNPSVIVFDESLSALDIKVQFSILELIRFINSVLGITVVFVSHDINSVYYLCNKVVVLNGGEIIDYFKGSDLFLEKRSSYTKKLIVDSNFI